MQTTPNPPAESRLPQLATSQRSPSANFLWICLILWAVSFFLPAARYDNWGQEATMPGWEAAWTALILFFIPVKGSWFGFDPHIWSVLANFLMLWAAFKIKRLNETNGRKFAIAFVIAAFVGVGLLFIPESLDLATIHAFLIGFALWALSIIGASGYFSWIVWRNRLALLPHVFLATLLFCGLLIWSPSIEGQRRRAEKQREQGVRQAEVQQQHHAENAAALNAISQRGLVAFDEPMTDAQESALEFQIRGSPNSPREEMIAASEHYQNPKIMDALASNPKCPPEALEILYRHATENEKGNPSEKGTAYQLYFAIAHNPNASSALLLKMLNSANPAERAAALHSGKLPREQKAAYLAKGCAVTDDSEMMVVAEDADTPVEILECLSTKPGAAIGLRSNPHTPNALLEQMSQSSDWRIANEAKVGLSSRKRQSN